VGSCQSSDGGRCHSHLNASEFIVMGLSPASAQRRLA
jgi:hypothetical protein